MASTLELLFDLVFVVAISAAAAQLHHALANGHAAHGVVSYDGLCVHLVGVDEFFMVRLRL